MFGALQNFGKAGQSVLSARELALQSAAAHFPLRTNLLALRGSSAITYTRATTATVFDHEGLMKTAISGEARFTGARRVANLIPAAGSGSATLAVAAAKTVTVTAGIYAFSMGLGTGTATFSGTGGATGTLAANATNRTTSSFTLTAGTFIVTASVATLIDLQLEDVTGQAIQTPSEYVSVGVLSSPWHGAGADGIKDFDTANGNTVTSNVVTEATGAPLTTLKGILAEPLRTNLVYPSVGWPVGPGYTKTANYAVSPDGTTTAMRLQWSGSANAYAFASSFISVAGSTYTSQFWVKENGTSSKIALYQGDPSGAYYAIAEITANTGAITTSSFNGGGDTITNVSATAKAATGGGWYVTLTATHSAAVELTSGTNTVTNAAGDVVCSLLGFELGATASSYIATTTVAVARNTDAASIPTSGNITGAAGSVYIEWTPVVSYNNYHSIIGCNNPGVDGFVLQHDGGTVLYFTKSVSSVNTNAFKSAFPLTAGTTYKLAFSWGAAGQFISASGASGTSHASTTTIAVGSTVTLNKDIPDNHRNLRTWTTQLSQAQLNALTAA